MEISLTQQTFLYLLNCAVNERVSEKLPVEVDFEELYKLSRFHSVTAMVSYALDKGGYLKTEYMPQELIQKWASARIGAIRKNLMFDAEREAIFKHLEEIGCWYMPLKGVILKEMYPDVGMREMCDNDILFDGSFRVQLKKYMVNLGYKVESFKVFVDDAYIKKPIYNFEFHTNLFSDCRLPEWFDYYRDIKDCLLKDKDNGFGYHFGNEDFYIYMIAHAAKHYDENGIGIRFLADQSVYLKNTEMLMDWTYVRGELKKLGIDRFEEEVKLLSKKLLNSNGYMEEMYPLEENENRILSYLFQSGTYGTISNKVKKGMSSLRQNEERISFITKLKYLFRRLFPGKEHMREYEPFVYQHQWLIPFFWIYRILVRAPFMKSKKILVEFRSIINVK